MSERKAMMDLIVDFPSSRSAFVLQTQRSKLRSILIRGSIGTRAKRSVRFSETSFLTIVERSSQEELKRRWYSKKDKDEFKLQHKRDIQTILRKLASTPMHSIFKDDLHNCLGIELFLSYDILTNTPERRYNHIYAILGAQHRQRRLHVNNADELSMISMKSSEWASSRAHSIAAMYAMIPMRNCSTTP